MERRVWSPLYQINFGYTIINIIFNIFFYSLGTRLLDATTRRLKHSTFGLQLLNLKLKPELPTFCTKTLATGNRISRIWAPLNVVICALKLSSTVRLKRYKFQVFISRWLFQHNNYTQTFFKIISQVAVCNLASIALNMFVKPDRTFDLMKLKEITKVITRNLNKIIEVNYYPVPEVSSYLLVSFLM